MHKVKKCFLISNSLVSNFKTRPLNYLHLLVLGYKENGYGEYVKETTTPRGVAYVYFGVFFFYLYKHIVNQYFVSYFRLCLSYSVDSLCNSLFSHNVDSYNDKNDSTVTMIKKGWVAGNVGVIKPVLSCGMWVLEQ